MNHIITKASATGLKGPAFSYALSPFTILCGDNFKGKSRVMDAIRLGLLGYLPELGKTPAKTMDLADGALLSVDIAIGAAKPAKKKKATEPDAAYAVSRTWAFNGRSVTANQNLAIPEELLARLPVSLNIADYFAKTPGERLNYLFGAVAGEGTYDRTAIVAQVKNIVIPGEANTPETEAVIKACVGIIVAYPKDTNARDFFTLTIEGFKSLLSGSKAVLKRMTGTVQGLTQLQAMEQQLASLDAASLNDLLTKAREESRVAVAALATLTERQRARDTAMTKRRDALAFIETHKDFNDAEFERLSEAADLAEKKMDDAGKEWRRVQAVLNESRSKYSSVKGRWDRATSDHAAARQEVEGIQALSCCPTCDAKNKGWRDKVETAAREKLAKTAADLLAAKGELDKVTTEGKQAAAVCEAAEKKFQELNSASVSATKLVVTMGRIKSQLAIYREAIGGDLTDEVTAEEITKARTKLQTCNERIAKLQDKSNEAQRLQQDIRRIAQAQKEQAAAEAETKVYDAVVKLLDSNRTKLIDAAVQTVIGPANQIIGGLMPALRYEDGEFGYQRGVKFVKSSTFSGAQQALAYCGISLGLAASCELRVGMVDELARLHVRNLPTFFASVAAAIESGLLGQFIGVIPMDAKDVAVLLNEANVGSDKSVIIEIS